MTSEQNELGKISNWKEGTKGERKLEELWKDKDRLSC
jgi:hypothetical protein